MNQRLPLTLKQSISKQLSSTYDKYQKISLFPFINKENHYQTDQVDNRYASKTARASQYKPNVVPLTSRPSINCYNQTSILKDRKEKSQKKHCRPFAAKPKSLSSKMKGKKSTVESRQISTNQGKYLKLDKIKPKLGETLVQNEAMKTQDLQLLTVNLQKTTSLNNRSPKKFTFRDRTNSCKVAFKKVFPQPQKLKNPSKLNIFFENNEEKLSTIPGGSQNGSQKFISMQSYSQLIF